MEFLHYVKNNKEDAAHNFMLGMAQGVVMIMCVVAGNIVYDAMKEKKEEDKK